MTTATAATSRARPTELSCVLSATYWDGGRYVVRGFLTYVSSSQLSPNSSPYSSRYVPSVHVPIRPLRLQQPPPRINEASRAMETRRCRHRRHRRLRHRHRCCRGDQPLPRQSQSQNHKYITMVKKARRNRCQGIRQGALLSPQRAYPRSMAERAPEDSASGRAARREGHAQSQSTGAALLQMQNSGDQQWCHLSHHLQELQGRDHWRNPI